MLQYSNRTENAAEFNENRSNFKKKLNLFETQIFSLILIIEIVNDWEKIHFKKICRLMNLDFLGIYHYFFILGLSIFSLGELPPIISVGILFSLPFLCHNFYPKRLLTVKQRRFTFVFHEMSYVEQIKFIVVDVKDNFMLLLFCKDLEIWFL